MSSKDLASKLINEAKSLFVDEDFDAALQKFNEAINLDSTNSEFYTHRSGCHHKMENFTEAMADAKKAIELDPTNSRAYFRKGLAAFSLDEFETAKQAFLKAQELAPSAQNKTWIRKCDAELADEKDEDGESSGDDLIPKVQPTTAPKPNVDGPPPLEVDEPKKVPIPVPTPQTSVPTPQTHSQVHTVTSTPLQTPSQTPVVSNQPTITPSQSQPVSNTAPAPASNKPRHEWYQTNSHVFISVFIKNVKNENANINITEKNVDLEIRFPETSSEYQINFNLLDSVVAAESSYSILTTKIDFKLKKSRESRWSSLENTGGSVQTWDVVVDTKKEKGLSYPSSSKHGTKNWDSLNKDNEKEEEKLDGDSALNKLFQDIYKGASDEQRRAMQKSFQESGGTVLSTNWDEVGKGEVKGAPPKGMEMKYWKDL